MSEVLIVSNFASMKEVELNINKINILIGPQATGKSVCAKLLYFFKSFTNEILNSIIDGKTKRELDDKLKDSFNNYFPPSSLNQGSFEIKYTINNNYISISKTDKGKLQIQYSSYYKELLSRIRNHYKHSLNKIAINEDYDPDDAAIELRSHFNKTIQREIDSTSSYTQFFIPAGRSFFANLQSSIFTFLSSNNALDPFLIEFGSFYERVKSFSKFPKNLKKEIKNIEAIEKYSSLILNGKYIHEKGKDFLLLQDNRKINIRMHLQDNKKLCLYR